MSSNFINKLINAILLKGGLWIKNHVNTQIPNIAKCIHNKLKVFLKI